MVVEVPREAGCLWQLVIAAKYSLLENGWDSRPGERVLYLVHGKTLTRYLLGLHLTSDTIRVNTIESDFGRICGETRLRFV